MARDWRGWVALGLLAVAGSAQACFVAPGVEQVAPGILRMPPRSPEVSWAVVPVDAALPESRLRRGGAVPECIMDFTDATEGPALVSVDASNPQEVRISLAPGDHVYGLGDKAGPMERRGRFVTFWNTDAYAWDAARDPLYKSIPFLIVERAGRVFGVFADATQRMTADVGKTDPNVITLSVAEGAIDLYLIDGPTPHALLQRYTALTGRTPLPPKWALGFQQSRYTYLPEARVRQIAKTLRDKRIPADAIWLDIGFQEANKPFTVDRKAFPDFEGMLGDLRKDGFHTVLITDLHIAQQVGYAPYESGKAIDAFVKRAGADYVGKVWPGDSVFPDFSRTQVREWWGGLYTDFVRMGAAGFWNDMNEPSVFDVPGGTMPDDVMHRYDDGSTRTHAQLHNVYGMLNARATYEGLRKLKPDERPFVLTRAAYAGTQRYAATWTGDNTADWHHLAQGVPNILSLGLSGMALAGDDIGGFIGSPPPDLLTRWYQLGAWQPIFRSHAATDTRDHEPWVDGPEHEALRRSAIEQRYRLMPYLYTLAEENARTGAPITRPVWFEFPTAGGSDRDFLFGRDVFVAPVVSERLDAHVVQLPPGAWYGLRDGKRYRDKVTFDSGVLSPAASSDPLPNPSPGGRGALRDVPVFVRAGAIVPMQAVVQHTGQVPKGPLEVHVWWPEGDVPCDGALYDDDGTSMAYQRGAFVRIAFTCRVEGDALVVEAKFEYAGFAPWWRAADVIAHRPDGTTQTHHIADATANWHTVIPAKAGIQAR